MLCAVLHRAHAAKVLFRFPLAKGLIYSPVAMAVVTDIAGEQKGGWLSWFSSLTTVGGLLGPPLGGFLLSVLEPSGSSLYEFRVAYEEGRA